MEMMEYVIALFCISTTVNCESIKEHLEEYRLGLHLACHIENETELCLTLEGEHKCGYPPSDILWCDDGRLITLNSYCVTLDEDNNLLEIGNCAYKEKHRTKNETSIFIEHHKLPENASELNKDMCGVFNRNGTLCGECKDGYSLLAYSYDMTCVECSSGKYNWWKFVLAAFLPLTVFYFIIFFFRINVTSSHLHGFVLFSHCAFIPALQRLVVIGLYKTLTLTIIRYFVALYAIWNLDFFRSFPLGICLEIDTLPTLALDLAVGMYPLLLMLMSYFMINLYDRNFTPLVIMWKPFKALFGFFLKNVDIRTSLIDSFATFFLLSNMKFLNATFSILIPVQVYQVPLSDPFNVTVSWRLFYDATIPYLGKTHLPYAVLAIAVFAIFILFPILIILLYPFRWFHKLLNIFPLRWYVLHTFVDAFLGCYKDGTEPGTRDCRWFAAMFLLIRPVFMLIGAYTLNAMCFILCTILIIFFIIALTIIEPFKTRTSRFADSNIVFLILLAIDYLCIINKSKINDKVKEIYEITAIIIVGFVTFLYISVVTIHWIFSHRTFGLKLVREFCSWRHEHDLLDK